MPVRTSRGRAAALRRLWSWPLRSWYTVAVTGAVTAAVVTAVALSLPTTPTTPTPQERQAAAQVSRSRNPSWTPHWSITPPSANRSSSSPTSGPHTEATPTTTSAAETTPATTREQDAVDIATVFVERWARPAPGTPPEQWTNGLMPYVLPESMIDLTSIDPANVPVSAVTGEATVVGGEESMVEVAVPTDAGTITVTVLAQTDGRWLVRSWTPEEP